MPEVTIAIRGFTYMREVPDPLDRDKSTYVSAFATRGQTVEVSDAEYEQGQALGAFTTNDEEAPEGAFSVVDASDDELDDYLNEESPNVSETVALAGNDPESAQRILDAEERVTDGEPRQGVEDGLTKIIEG